MQILNQAKDYVYITTPYLIVDGSMVSALCLAAKSGVDVRIITPQVWDKALIHMTTRSYYRELMTGLPALGQPIWIFGVCIFTLNAAFGCVTTALFCS